MKRLERKRLSRFIAKTGLSKFQFRLFFCFLFCIRLLLDQNQRTCNIYAGVDSAAVAVAVAVAAPLYCSHQSLRQFIGDDV